MTACTYCGCDVTAHDPVSVVEGAVVEGGDDVSPGAADPFCNYACLAAHIEEAGLTTGATCEVDL